MVNQNIQYNLDMVSHLVKEALQILSTEKNANRETMKTFSELHSLAEGLMIEYDIQVRMAERGV